MIPNRITAALLAAFSFLPQLPTTEIRWDWSTIDTTDVVFPKTIEKEGWPCKEFLWGVTGCEYQNSGADHCPTCNWADWEKTGKTIECDEKGNCWVSGSASNTWELYKEDIKRLKDLGVNTYSFSIAWSRIEPKTPKRNEAGQLVHTWNAEAIKHYHDMFRELKKNGIKPFVSIHHFTHPDWFENMGAFEQEKNIEYLLDFTKKMVSEYKDAVKMWCTIIEPGVYAFQGYFRGVWPPGKKNDFNTMGLVTKNMMKAHTQMYKAIKVIDKDALVGLSHSITQFDPYHPWNPIEHGVTTFLNHIMHGAITHYFKTGYLRFNVPALGYVNYTFEDEDIEHPLSHPKDTLDFIGLNYYSHVLIGMQPKLNMIDQMFRQDDIKTAMPYSIYAEGLCRAIKDVSGIGKPIMITENGASDTKDEQRTLFVQRYLYALSKSIKDGYDIRGYFHWTLTDNWEWDMGYNQRFGLYHVDFKTKKRTMRNSGKYYRDVLSGAVKKGFKPVFPSSSSVDNTKPKASTSGTK